MTELVDKLIDSMESSHDLEERTRRLDEIKDLVKDDAGADLVSTLTDDLPVASTEDRVSIVKAFKLLNGTAWDYFIDSMDNSRSQAENKLNRIKYLKDSLERNRYDGGKGSVPFQMQYSSLLLKGRVVTGSELVKAVDDLSTIIANETVDEMDFILRISSKMIPEVNNLLRRVEVSQKHEELSGYLAEIAELGNLAVQRRNKLPYLTPMGNADGKSRYESNELVGGVKLTSNHEMYETASIRAVGLPQFRTVASIFNMRTKLDNNTVVRRDLKEIPKLSELEARRLLRAAEIICNDIIRFKIRYGMTFSKDKRTFSDLRDKLDRMGRGGENIEHKIYLRKAADAANSTARWIHTPVMPLVGHGLRVVTAIISYVDASVHS